MQAPLRIAIAGASGRMGRMLIEAVLAAPDCTLAGALDVADSAQIGQDPGAFLGRATGLTITADLEAVLAASQVLIDFTRPEGTLRHLEPCAARGVALVIGTTGLDDAQRAHIARAAESVPIVLAANFSIGVNLLLGLVAQAAATLGPEYDIEILEMHHRRKIDAPSGTALALGEAAASGRGAALETLRLPARDGLTGPRAVGPIGFAALRGGDVIGDHIVMFAGSGERIELTHKASDRGIFAAGALRAARWVVGRAPGLYAMQDVLTM